MLTFLTAASIVWSARAYSYLISDKPYRNFLRRSARRREIENELKLSERYHQRHATNQAKNRADSTTPTFSGEGNSKWR